MMKKLFISFTTPQLAYLEEEATRLGIRIPELVRRVIDAHRKAQS